MSRPTGGRARWKAVPPVVGVDASRAARPRRTGTENYAYHLIRALLAMGADYRYRLYLDRGAPMSSGDLFPPGPWEARVIPFPRLWTHLRLSWEVSRDPPDLLFVPAHVLPLVHPRRSVATVHDLGFRHFPQAHRSFDRWYLEWSTRYHAHSAAHLLVDSESTRADLVEAYGTAPDRITVVYPGRDESLVPVSDGGVIEAVKARYGIHGEYILYLGTLHPRKNLSRLVDAFSVLSRGARAAASRRKLVLAGGTGWLNRPLLEQVADLGLSDRVVFTGYVPHDDLAPLLSGAECLAFPSLYEGFGLPVLEAMACGVPVICSNTSSLPEAAGQAALLVDPLDTGAWVDGLDRLLNDVELRHSLVHRGYRQVQKFSWQGAAQQVLRVFAEVLDG